MHLRVKLRLSWCVLWLIRYVLAYMGSLGMERRVPLLRKYMDDTRQMIRSVPGHMTGLVQKPRFSSEKSRSY